ncbi:uncharacterized protein LOC111386944 [Olea europaea var. sylvestris]|uniref:uncharacterized protein LOC111386944 n=1 Tax=Olea europaea var. sylvestris TaxID=158386 RepID=UPI000C1D1DDF|nr:uncharacterized protein LOC111386944 [Olea europaea var. sylvestris]
MDKSPENTEGFETLEPKDITRRLADMAKKLLLVYVQSFEEPIVLQLLVGHDSDHFTTPEGVPGVPETNFNNRPNSFKVLSPARTCVVYYRVEETLEETDNDKSASLTETDIGNKMHSSTISFEGASSSGDKGVGPSKELTETEAL